MAMLNRSLNGYWTAMDESYGSVLLSSRLWMPEGNAKVVNPSGGQMSVTCILMTRHLGSRRSSDKNHVMPRTRQRGQRGQKRVKGQRRDGFPEN